MKRFFEFLIQSGEFLAEDIGNIFLFCDQHSTTTNGYYDLQESIYAEFKKGLYNYRYNTFHAPITPKLESVIVKYCDSNNTTLIRTADIIANRIYYFTQYEPEKLTSNKNLYITFLP